jgi:hypothetical protein
MPPPKVVVSYNHIDVRDVESLVQDLRGVGIDVWWDRKGVRPGDNWKRKVEDALIAPTDCRTYMLLLAGESGLGEAQRQEVDFARNHRDRVVIIPVLLRNGKPKVFDMIGTADLSVADLSKRNLDDHDENWERLVETLHPEGFLNLMRQLAILHAVDLKPHSCFVSISNPLARGHWVDFFNKLTSAGFTLLEDNDPRPDAFASETRSMIRSACVVCLDARLAPKSDNIAPDVAYALGIARSYSKPIVLLVNDGSVVVDRTSVFRVIECKEKEELSPELVEQIVGGVAGAYRELCSPYLTTGDGESIALTFSDVNVCPHLRADVFSLTELFNRRWHELERISQGLCQLLGTVQIAVAEKDVIHSSDIMQRISNRFFQSFQETHKDAFESVESMVTNSAHQLDEAKRVIERIRRRTGRKGNARAENVGLFLHHFYERLSWIEQCHRDGIGLHPQNPDQDDAWSRRGPDWWQQHVSIQLKYIQEARGFLEQFFSGLMDILRPGRPEIRGDGSESRIQSRAASKQV